MDGLKTIAEVKNNVYLANVFDIETFMDNSKLGQVIRTQPSKAEDRFSSMANVEIDYNIISTMVEKFSEKFAKKVVDDVIATFPDVLRDIIFYNSFMPYITETYKSNVKAEQIKRNVDDLVNNINTSNPERIVAEVQSMPESSFSFGEKLFLTPADFKIDVFKRDMSTLINKAFFTVFYYKHLVVKGGACAGVVECQRIYSLAQYVFVYFTITNLFLVAFGSSELVDKYMKATKKSMQQVDQDKNTLTIIMEQILSRLQEKNLYSQGTANSNSNSLTAYQNNIKDMSTTNKNLSQDLVTKKSNLQTLQNNLASYNSMEMVTHRATITANISLWVTFVLCIILVGGVAVLLMRGRYASADVFMVLIAGGIVLLLTQWYVTLWQSLVGFFTQ